MSSGIVSRLPLLRGLLQAGPSSHMEAMAEFLVVFIFSMIPLVATAVLMKAGAPPESPQGFMSSMWKLISGGELILYSASFLSGTLYLVFSSGSGQQNFRDRLPQGVLVLLVIICSYIVYLFNYFSFWKDKDFLVEVSVWLYVASLLLLYCSLVFERGLRLIGLREQEEDSIDKFRAHMRGGAE